MTVLQDQKYFRHGRCCTPDGAFLSPGPAAGRGVFVPVARDAEFMRRESLESRDYDRAEGRYRICRHVLQPEATAARGHDGTVAQRPRPPIHPSLRRAP